MKKLFWILLKLFFDTLIRYKNSKVSEGMYSFSLQVKSAGKSVVPHNKENDVQTFSEVIRQKLILENTCTFEEKKGLRICLHRTDSTGCYIRKT